MNTILEQINTIGKSFVEFALPMLAQFTILFLILLIIDFLLRKKVRSVFRYWIWMLVLAKLILPTSLSSPLSLGYLFGDSLTSLHVTPAIPQPQKQPPAVSPQIIDFSTVPLASDTSSVVTSPPSRPSPTQPFSSQSAQTTPLSWQGVVFLLWLAVVIAMGLLLLQRAIFVAGLVAQAVEADDSIKGTFNSCCERIGIRRRIGLKVSANATSPAVCGLFSQVILLPQNLSASLSSSQLQSVLLHELAHIKRGDLWINLAQTILQIFYFYNPLLWIANAIIRRIREQAVDEMVLVAMGDKAQQYLQTLVSVAKLAFKRPVLSLRLIGVVESKSVLASRIKRIVTRPIPKSAKLGIVGLIVVIIAAAVLIPMAKREKVIIGEGPEREMTLTLGWSGEKVKIPAPVVLPEWGRKTKEFELWKLGIVRREITVFDIDDYKYVAQGHGRKKNVKGELNTVLYSVERYRPNRTLEAYTLYSEADGAPTEWRTYNEDGNKRIWVVNLPTAGDCKRKVIFYGPDGKETKKWQVSEFDVVYAELVTDPNGQSYFTHYLKELIHSSYPKQFAATLPNGVTVELVGVCEYPSAGKPWWRPDGTPFTLPAGIRVEDSIRKAGVGDNAYQFLFRYNSQEDLTWNSLDAVCLHFAIEGHSGTNLINMKRLPKGGQDGLVAKVAIFKEPLDSTTIQANLATGNWQTQAVRDISKIDQRNEDLYWFTSKTPSTGNVSLDILHRIEGQQIKTIAIDREGNEYNASYSLGSFGGWGSVSGSVQNTPKDVRGYIAVITKDDRLVKFKLQSRPFWSSVIGNVSLKPNLKTDVQAKSEKKLATVGEPNQVRGRIRGVVVNSVTGKPIEGAYVGVGDFGDSGGSNYSRHRSQGFFAKAKTDPNGRFELDGLAYSDEHPEYDLHPLVVTHPDFVRHDEKIKLLKGKPAPDVRISLKPAAKINVTVVDSDGKPLEGLWLFRLEALDGRYFIPPGRDPHLSSFVSSVWIERLSPKRDKLFTTGFSFAGLAGGEYSIDVMQFAIIDNYSPPPSGMGRLPLDTCNITYYGGITKLNVEAAEIKEVQIKPTDYQTSVTIKMPEDPVKKPQIPPFVVISRNVGLLAWDDGKAHGPEDERLGRLEKNALYYNAVLDGDVFKIKNLPPGIYSVFAGPIYFMSATKMEVSSGRETTFDIPAIKVSEHAKVGLWTFDRKVKPEARDYSVSELCELINAKTDSNPRLVPDPSIENQKIKLAEKEMSIWEALEMIYLNKGWKVKEGEEKTLILHP
jgi:beta-lactamase regulating signal transducer with metallopeptidase domain